MDGREEEQEGRRKEGRRGPKKMGEVRCARPSGKHVVQFRDLRERIQAIY